MALKPLAKPATAVVPSADRSWRTLARNEALAAIRDERTVEVIGCIHIQYHSYNMPDSFESERARDGFVVPENSAYTSAMCVNYTPPQLARLLKMAGMSSTVVIDYPRETWPMYRAPVFFAIDTPEERARAEPWQQFRIDPAYFGLIPRWTKESLAQVLTKKRVTNVRSETIATKASYRAPWRECKFALIPMQNFYESYYGPEKDWEHPVRSEIFRRDRELFTVAALWERSIVPESGEIILSFSTITINATGHPLMGRFHAPDDEERQQVVIPPELRDEWLRLTNAEDASRFFTAMPVEEFDSAPAPKPPRRAAAPKTKKLRDEVPSEEVDASEPSDVSTPEVSAPDLFGDVPAANKQQPPKDKAPTKPKPPELPKPETPDLFG